MALEVGPIQATLTSDVSPLTSGLSKAASALKGVGVAAAGATAALGATGAVVADLSGDFADFESSVIDAGAKAGATSDQLDKMSDAAIRAGQTSLFSSTKAADAMGFLAQAGFSVNEQMDALPGTLELATAGNLELARAADIATDTLSGMGLATDELSRVNDVLVKTANSANTSVGQLGEGLSQAAPLASSAGIELEQVTAVLGQLASAGIKGSQGGVAVRAALSKLQDPSNKARQALESVGIAAEDIQPILSEEGLTGVIERMAERSEETGKIMTQAFGTRAGPKLQALVNQGTESVRGLRKELEAAGGTAESVTAKKVESLSGQIRIMKGSVQTAKVALGEELKPVAGAVADEITNLANDVTDMSKKSDEASESITELANSSRQLTKSGGRLGMTLGSTLLPAMTRAAAGSADLADTTLKAAGDLVGMTEVSEESARGTQRLANEMGGLQSALNAAGIFSQRYSGSLEVLGTGTDRVHNLQMELNEAVQEYGLESKQAQAIAEKLRKEMNKQGKSIVSATHDWEALSGAVMDAAEAMVGQQAVSKIGEGFEFASEKIDQAETLLGKVKDRMQEADSESGNVASTTNTIKSNTGDAADEAERFKSEMNDVDFRGGFSRSRQDRKDAASDITDDNEAGRFARALPTPDTPERSEENSGKFTGLIESDASGEEVQASEEALTEARNESLQTAKSLTGEITGLTSALADAGAMSEKAASAIGGIGGAAQSVLGGLSSGNPFGIASGIIGGVTSLIQGFGGDGGTTSSANKKRDQKKFADLLATRIADEQERRGLQPVEINVAGRSRGTQRGQRSDREQLQALEEQEKLKGVGLGG